MGTSSQGTVDELDFSDVWEASAAPGNKVTMTVPTDTADTRAAGAGIALKSLIGQARAALLDSGQTQAEADAILEPAAELVKDSSYWRLQSRGLIIFAAPGYFRAVRVPVALAQEASVGSRFHTLPIADVLSEDGKCYILALAKNSVRLFDSTRNSITELPLGQIPGSFAEVVQEEFQPNLQGRSAGESTVMYHGQGDNSDVEQRQTEEFISAVAKGVGEELGTARSQPLVLATVEEHLPVFRAACAYPTLNASIIRGNPEHSSPEQLRSAAWRVLEDGSRDAEDRDRALNRVHAGRGSLDVAEIARAASEGRVDTLYLAAAPAQYFNRDETDLLDGTIVDVERSSGGIRTLQTLGEGERVVATFRY